MVYATSSTSPGRRIGMKRIRSARTAGSAVRPDVRIGGMNVALTVHPFELVVNVVCCNRL